jgi:aryl-alcohol dehydrogenase-like predicted oxidoreductase
MLMRTIGSSGISASAIGLGTWGMGGWMWGGADEKAAIAAVQAALDAGVTLIDTAPAYGLGLAEEIVGKAIAGRRHRVILATKCGLVWHTDQGAYYFDEHGKAVYRYLGAASIRYEVEQSLRRLRTDVIDLYQTHWQDPTTPVAETMATLLDLKREGKIGAIGVSNVTRQHLYAYEQVGKLDSVQEQYNMLDREAEQEIVPYACAHNLAMLSYSSLALGLLTGKIGPERQFEGDDQRIDNERFSSENRRRVAAMLAQFAPIAAGYGLTLAQLVIAWTIAQPGITFALCGARTPEQALENAAAGAVSLRQADLETMNRILAAHRAAIV